MVTVTLTWARVSGFCLLPNIIVFYSNHKRSFGSPVTMTVKVSRNSCCYYYWPQTQRQDVCIRHNLTYKIPLEIIPLFFFFAQNFQSQNTPVNKSKNFKPRTVRLISSTRQNLKLKYFKSSCRSGILPKVKVLFSGGQQGQPGLACGCPSLVWGHF